MKLKIYIDTSSVTQAGLARRLGVPAVLVHQWAKELRRVPAERCPTIERITNGAVRCEDMRPDVEWWYIRGTARKPKRKAT